MSHQTLARQHYTNSQRELASDKAIEIHIFSSITSRMRAINMEEIGAMSKLAEALNDNVKLWNILMIDLTRPENPLPHSLKTSIIELAEFTQKHTFKVLSGSANHDVLIDINTAIINGLRESLRLENQMKNDQRKVA